MSKTFGQLKAGDEVYIIKDCNVEIVKVESVNHYSESNCTFYTTCYGIYSTAMGAIICWGKGAAIIYSDIDEAMRTMQDICANALHNYREASGALNKLETKKKMI